jgi:histone H3/H4
MSEQIPSQKSFWRKCSSCRKEIPYGANYYRCSVSTCQHERSGFRFCSVTCWDVHLGYTFHRSAFAEEAKAPSHEQVQAEQAVVKPKEVIQREPVRKIVEEKSQSAPLISKSSNTLPKTDTLVVVSKVKQLIKDQVGFNTSECCIEALTRKVVEESLKGIARAQAAGRKTVMGRDVI